MVVIDLHFVDSSQNNVLMIIFVYQLLRCQNDFEQGNTLFMKIGLQTDEILMLKAVKTQKLAKVSEVVKSLRIKTSAVSSPIYKKGIDFFKTVVGNV